VPAGWDIAPGDADDIRVCGAHRWQSSYLVFADTTACGTAMCPSPSYIGTQSPNAEFTKNFGSNYASRPKLGKKYSSSGYLVQDTQGATAKCDAYDVLLRRRA
jgi:hypothetical protein